MATTGLRAGPQPVTIREDGNDDSTHSGLDPESISPNKSDDDEMDIDQSRAYNSSPVPRPQKAEPWEIHRGKRGRGKHKRKGDEKKGAGRRIEKIDLKAPCGRLYKIKHSKDLRGLNVWHMNDHITPRMLDKETEYVVLLATPEEQEYPDPDNELYQPVKAATVCYNLYLSTRDQFTTN